jgi:hypothetical protein
MPLLAGTTAAVSGGAVVGIVYLYERICRTSTL